MGNKIDYGPLLFELAGKINAAYLLKQADPEAAAEMELRAVERFIESVEAAGAGNIGAAIHRINN